jgi:DNA polymerase
MLIGEAPGKMEDAKGVPFIGKSGSELDHLYLGKCAELSRTSVYVTNLVKCRTNDKDRDPTEAEIGACSHILREEILQVNPRYIGLVGKLATQFFIPDARMEKVHGFGYELPIVFDNGKWNAKLFMVMPLYHPSYGLHNTTMMRHIMGDFERFGRMVRGDTSVMWRGVDK